MASIEDAAPLAILDALGIEAAGPPEALTPGVSCHAWRVATHAGALVVRVEREDRLPQTSDDPRFEAQAGILTRLAEVDPGLPTPRHVATAAALGDGDPLEGRTWSVDEAIDGVAWGDHGSGEPAVLAALGGLLRALHGLPGEGFGMLEDRRAPLRGVAPDFAAGVLSRYERAWPYSGEPLVAHPVARVAPQLIGALGELREQLERYAGASSLAVLHGDLHPGHVLIDDGELAGVIDFGSAWVGPAAFDLASVAAYLGWDALEGVLAGYEERAVLRDVRRAEAEQLAVVLALHRLRRAVDEGRGDPARWVGFLEELLPRAARRADA